MLRHCFFIAVLVSAVFGQQCQWLFPAYEGMTQTYTLSQQWNCTGVLSIQTSGPVLSGFSVPYMRNPVIQYSPPFGSAGQQNQALTITCNLFTTGCTDARVYFYVRPSDQTTSTTTTTTTTTTTGAPTTTTTTTTLPPLPPGSTYAPTTATPSTTPAPPTTPVPTPSGPVYCSALPTAYLNTSTTSYLFPMNYVTNCVSPSIQFLGNTTAAIFTIAADQTTLVVDQFANNTAQDVYDASIGIFCGGVNVCLLTQRVVVTAPPVFTPAPTPAPLASCLPVYAYECVYGALTTLTLAGQDGATTCASPNSTVSYRLISAPTVNSANFSLDSATGLFVYVAPLVPSVDAFQFAIQCDGVDLCGTKAFLISVRSNVLPTPAPPTTATPAPATPAPSTAPPAPLPACAGVYSYVFSRLSNGSLPPQQGSLFFPPGGSLDCTLFANVTLRTNAFFGNVAIADPSSGLFTYTATTVALDWDNFTFALQCASPASMACEGRAKILVQNYTGPTEPPTPIPTTPPPFYRVSDNLVCMGTCNRNGWLSTELNKATFDVTLDDLGRQQPQRMDKQPLDKVAFRFNNNYDLLMEVFTEIGNMGARFPTFEPIPSSTGPFIPSAAASRNTAFNATCLGKQSRYGTGYELWEWTNFSNLEGQVSGSYASRYNYYQKFGGKHVECDTFRNDACTYAPLLNPASNVTNGVNWFLFVRDCDATWIGEATLSTLRALRSSTGAPLFTNKGDKQIVGQLTTEAVKPASWVRPNDGILTSVKTYDVMLTTRQLVVSNALTVGYQVPSVTTVPPAPTTTTTVAPTTTSNVTNAPTASPNGTDIPNGTTTTTDGLTSTNTTTTTAPPTTTITTTTTSAPNTTTTSAPSNVTTTTVAPDVTVAPNTTTPAPWPLLPIFSSDVMYTITSDPATNERLYRYNVLVYPPIAAAVNFSQLSVTAVRLQNFSWRAPASTCAECTGTVYDCLGNGIDLGDSCNGQGFVAIASGDRSAASCPNATTFPPVNGVSNVAKCPQTLFNVSVLARVSGTNSANSVGQAEGTLNLLIDFSNGQTVAVSIAQESYISQIDSASGGTPGLVTKVCRPLEYYPVLDLLGSSVVTNPYTSPDVKMVTSSPTDTAAVCPVVSTPGQTTALSDSTTQDYSALCMQPDERVFGAKETVLIQFDKMGISNATFDYVLLTVDASEIVPHPLQEKFSFLLAGSVPMHERFFRRSILPWTKFASSLAVRQNGQIISFQPGALLRASSSSKMVKFTLEAVLTSTITGSTEVRIILPVSQSIDATTRNEPAYSPSHVKSSTNVLEEHKTSLLIILGLVGLCAVVAGVAVLTNPEQKDLILDQHRTIKKYLFGSKNEATARSNSPIPPVRPSPSATSAKEAPKKIVVGKPLTPSAVKARAEQQQQQQSAGSSAPASKQSSPTTRNPATPSVVGTRVTSPPRAAPEVEMRRVRDEEEVM